LIVGEPRPGSATYTLLLDEVPIASGRVQVGSNYFVIGPEELAAANLPAGETVDLRHPVTGLPGVWCPPACRDALVARGLLPQTETAFILSHVEHVLRQNLPHFLGVDETQGLLNARQKEPAHAAFAAAVSGDDRARLAFWRALRALVGEQVPITDWTRIIEAIGSRDLTDVDEIVRLVRLSLRDQLPGNRPSTSHVPVPEAWANHVRPVGASPRFAVSPSEAHQMIVDIRASLAVVDEPAALVTPTSALRLLVQRLTAYEFPTVSVLSQDEVSSGQGAGSIVEAERSAGAPPTGGA
jgi:flagellar biosynthesis protein FlhA